MRKAIRRENGSRSIWRSTARIFEQVLIAPKCDEDLLEDPAVRDELLARRGYAREIRNRYAGAVPDADDDRVRAAGQAHGGSDAPHYRSDRTVDRGDYTRGDSAR